MPLFQNTGKNKTVIILRMAGHICPTVIFKLVCWPCGAVVSKLKCWNHLCCFVVTHVPAAIVKQSVNVRGFRIHLGIRHNVNVTFQSLNKIILMFQEVTFVLTVQGNIYKTD